MLDEIVNWKRFFEKHGIQGMQLKFKDIYRGEIPATLTYDKKQLRKIGSQGITIRTKERNRPQLTALIPYSGISGISIEKGVISLEISQYKITEGNLEWYAPISYK